MSPPNLSLALLDRRLVTDAVLAALRAGGDVIGDAVLPDANWVGQPNLPTSVLHPFSVLSPLNAGPPFGTIGDSRANWKLPYLVESYGVLREQCEWMGAHVRNLLTTMRGTYIDMAVPDGRYQVAYVGIEGIGEPHRIDVTDPEFWHAQDTFTVWLGRSRT